MIVGRPFCLEGRLCTEKYCLERFRCPKRCWSVTHYSIMTFSFQRQRIAIVHFPQIKGSYRDLITLKSFLKLESCFVCDYKHNLLQS